MKSWRCQFNVCVSVASIFTSSLVLGGCYYEIQDVRTGKAFYTQQWAAANGYQGPLTFEDHTGAKRRIEHAVVYRIGKREFMEATEPPPSDEASTPAP